MTVLNFPPTAGEATDGSFTYEENGVVYSWDGTKWTASATTFLSGHRNWIINGNFNINQRNGTRTPGVGVYGFDRWKGNAGGLEQVVEALPAGTYTLSWTGGGNGTFGGTTAASPITATVAAGNTSVVVPSNATLVQLERGTSVTPFEHRPVGMELSLCQRYFQSFGERVIGHILNADSTNSSSNGTFSFAGSKQTMRRTPQVNPLPPGGFGVCGVSGANLIALSSIQLISPSNESLFVTTTSAFNPSTQTQLRVINPNESWGLDAEF